MPTVRSVKNLDRVSPRRKDKAWIEAQQADPSARYCLLIDDKPAIVSDDERTVAVLRWFTHAEMSELGLLRFPAVFLGLDESGRPHFSMSISEHFARLVPGGPYCLKPYVDLRTLAVQGDMTPEDLSLAGLARAISGWHRAARCCGHCGSTTDVKDGGWRRKCWSCGQEHFPRTDPVVIMLVTDGKRCLLGHEERFGVGRYSTLAGFVEPGEDLEDAVRREVLEEVGIKVGDVHYQESQPWPFPYSLMIGCVAEALSSDITIDLEEIADARWFERDEIIQMMEGNHPDGLNTPGSYAIAYKLIRAWLDQ